jgi:hypothetical protein
VTLHGENRRLVERGRWKTIRSGPKVPKQRKRPPGVRGPLLRKERNMATRTTDEVPAKNKRSGPLSLKDRSDMDIGRIGPH